MSKTLQVLEKQIPKPTSVAEAIELDSRLEYLQLPAELHNQVLKDTKMKTAKVQIEDYSLTLDKEILEQLRRYKYRDGATPYIIVYTHQKETVVVKAVSALFYPIPLTEVWDAVKAKFGDPIEEKATRQAIIAQFAPVTTKYKRDGQIAAEDYEVKPTIAFSYNFAERSFELGFVVGVFSCTNQIFTFFGGDTRFVHNVHKIEAKGFTVESAINNLMEQLKTLEEVIEKAQETPLPLSAAPVLYWKGSRGQTSVLEKVYDEHAKLAVKKAGADQLTLWDGIMNLTYVSTHQIENYNSAVDMSMRAGSLLLQIGQLLPEDYVKALGFYLEHQRRTKDHYWKKELPLFQRLNLIPLMRQTMGIIDDLVITAEKSEEEASKASITENTTTIEVDGKTVIIEDIVTEDIDPEDYEEDEEDWDYPDEEE